MSWCGRQAPVRCWSDSGAAESTDAVQQRLRGLPGEGRVTTVFNTHWHREQVGGNLAFGRAGATIVAHEKTRAHLATDYYLFDEGRYEKALPKEARPTVTFFTGDQTLASDKRIEYGHLLEAHTDGDIYVFFRDANVLAAGDAISPVKDPELDWFGGGWLGGRVDAQEKLLKLTDAQTRIVPSYGPVVGRAELQAEFDMTRMLFDRMLDLIKKGMSAQDMLDAGLMKDLKRTFRTRASSPTTPIRAIGRITIASEGRCSDGDRYEARRTRSRFVARIGRYGRGRLITPLPAASRRAIASPRSR
jgi:glyoxylase-like metal-dependent hydrolase (beta-lactamase superfamily II)